MNTQDYLQQIVAYDKKVSSAIRERKYVRKRYRSEEEHTDESREMLRHYEDKVTIYLDELADLLLTISNQIDLIPNFNHRHVLRERYIVGAKWGDIAVNMHYSIRRVYELHEEALVELEKVRQAGDLAEKYI